MIFIHGPGGVGKSSLIREFARRAERRGRRAFWVEGREITASPDAVEDAVLEARTSPSPLVVFDTYERIAGLGGYLRRAILPSLPRDALVVIAGRRPPEGAWQQGGWENLVVDLRLAPVRDGDARAILAARGMRQHADTDRVVRWARGLPLALTLAARGAVDDAVAGSDLEAPGIDELLIRRLAAEELDDSHAATLAIAAVARVTTPEMLADVLPDASAKDEYDWLRALSFAEPLSDGVTLHDLVAKALHAHLRRTDEQRERELRVRIADHLFERAHRGEFPLSIDLAHLAEDPTLRWGYSWDTAAVMHADDPRPGDAEVLREFLHRTRRSESWLVVERFLRESPEHVTIVRDSEDMLLGYAIATVPEDAPSFAADDPLLGPRLAHARALRRTRALVARDVYDVAQRPDASPIPVLGMATILRAVRGNPRYAYLPINPDYPGAPEFAAALGARHVEELDVRLDGRLVECHVVDYGAGGLLAAQREVVHSEAGFPPPPREPDAADLHDAVRDALRALHVPQRLAESPLATGVGIEERAASVRDRLEQGVEHCFGDGPNEDLMRAVLTQGYLEPASSHELAADRLALSRSAYFRRLKVATERLADFLAASG